MTDKEKTLAFIEERIKWNEDMMQRDPKPSDIGRIEEAKCIRRFIDSLQEKPVSIWHDGCEIPKSETNILMIRKDENDSNYPPIAGRFNGTNSRLDGRNWGYYNGFCYNEIEPPVKWAYIDDIKTIKL